MVGGENQTRNQMKKSISAVLALFVAASVFAMPHPSAVKGKADKSSKTVPLRSIKDEPANYVEQLPPAVLIPVWEELPTDVKPMNSIGFPKMYIIGNPSPLCFGLLYNWNPVDPEAPPLEIFPYDWGCLDGWRGGNDADYLMVATFMKEISSGVYSTEWVLGITPYHSEVISNFQFTIGAGGTINWSINTTQY